MSYREEIIGGARLILGDCREVLGDLSGIGACVMDPPYGMNKEFANDSPNDADAIVADIIRWCRLNVTGNVLSFWSAQRMEAIHGVFSNPKRVMIWNKTFAIYSPHNVGYRYEPLVWVSGKEATTKRGDIFESFPIMFRAQEENANHPTQKPVALMTEIVRDFSVPTDTILDPFAGSGTTGVACAKLGRRFIGIEIEEKYHSIACRRIEQAQRQGDLLRDMPPAEDPADARMADMFSGDAA